MNSGKYHGLGNYYLFINTSPAPHTQPHTEYHFVSPSYFDFLIQLHRRAMVLNGEFQKRVYDLVARHAAALPGSSKADITPIEPIPGTQEPAICYSNQYHCRAEMLHLPPTGQHTQTECPIRMASPSHLPSSNLSKTSCALLRSSSSPPLARIPDLYLPEVGHSPGSFITRASSSAVLESNEILCWFRGGIFPVSVASTLPKTVSRMTEKVQEYVKEGADWPRTACILDPVRASIVVNGAAQIREVAQWFLEPAPAGQTLPVCRVKNKFAMSSYQLVSAFAQSI
jgi:hypothetical protein